MECLDGRTSKRRIVRYGVAENLDTQTRESRLLATKTFFFEPVASAHGKYSIH